MNGYDLLYNSQVHLMYSHWNLLYRDVTKYMCDHSQGSVQRLFLLTFRYFKGEYPLITEEVPMYECCTIIYMSNVPGNCEGIATPLVVGLFTSLILFVAVTPLSLEVGVSDDESVITVGC